MNQKAFGHLMKQPDKFNLQADQEAAPEADLSQANPQLLPKQACAEPAVSTQQTDRTFRLFLMATGVNSGKRKGFPQHAWHAFLEDDAERIIWTNADTTPEAQDGSQFDVLIAGLRASVDQIPDGAMVFILSPQKGLIDLYLKTREQRREERYKSGKKPRPQAKLLREIDDATEERGITLIGRVPELHHEYDRLEDVREGANARWAECGGDRH